MNAVGMATHAGPPNMTKTRAVMTKAMKYMGKVHPPTSAYDPHVFRHAAAGDLLRDNDRHFNEFVFACKFEPNGVNWLPTDTWERWTLLALVSLRVC